MASGAANDRSRFLDGARRAGLTSGCATAGEPSGSAQPGSEQGNGPAAGERDQRRVGGTRMVCRRDGPISHRQDSPPPAPMASARAAGQLTATRVPVAARTRRWLCDASFDLVGRLGGNDLSRAGLGWLHGSVVVLVDRNRIVVRSLTRHSGRRLRRRRLCSSLCVRRLRRRRWQAQRRSRLEQVPIGEDRGAAGGAGHRSGVATAGVPWPCGRPHGVVRILAGQTSRRGQGRTRSPARRCRTPVARSPRSPAATH